MWPTTVQGKSLLDEQFLLTAPPPRGYAHGKSLRGSNRATRSPSAAKKDAAIRTNRELGNVAGSTADPAFSPGGAPEAACFIVVAAGAVAAYALNPIDLIPDFVSSCHSASSLQ
jgi:Protein of unknown function (DUF1232)